MENELTTRINGYIYKQFGKEVLVTQMKYKYLESLFEVDRHVQRELDVQKRAAIRDFIMKSLETGFFYFSPCVFSSRGNLKQVGNGWEMKVGDKLYVLDGQHRILALSSTYRKLGGEKTTLEDSVQYKEELEHYNEMIKKLEDYPVTMQIYLNLTPEEEKQLFSDINMERKELHSGLILQYDHRDKYAELTRKVVESLRDELDIEERLSRISKESASITTMTTMKRCLTALFEGVLTVKKGDPYFKGLNPDGAHTVACSFFLKWLELFPSKMHDRKRYVCGLSGIQIALAYTVYLIKRYHQVTHQEAIDLLGILKDSCTWRHDDPLFATLFDSNKKLLINHSSITAITSIANKFIDQIMAKRKARSL
ncbi:DNA sulfur modification protein DndB [Fictibacillus sp. Mic-4]|uniref:DNA sulfur modification protein DndB n=1 Tax=Fictibacillus sp. Mic-4 TaxID=3132826 RepID=UPI003CF26EC1